MGEIDNIPSILVVGGANTGRSPMAAALLRRILAKRHLSWQVESVGVLGHDDDPAELEACSAMHAIDLDITAHTARSITDDLVQTATVILAIDTGIIHVLRNQHPVAIDKAITLGKLAGRERDIPDPYRMQVATWISYAREIEELLLEGIDNLIVRVQQCLHASGESAAGGESVVEATIPEWEHPQPPVAQLTERPEPPEPTVAQTATTTATNTLTTEQVKTRTEHVERCIRLMQVVRDMPTIVAWAQVRAELDVALGIVEKLAMHTGDLIYSYVNLYSALLGMQQQAPDRRQADLLLAQVEKMYHPIDQQMVVDLSALVVRWSQE